MNNKSDQNMRVEEILQRFNGEVIESEIINDTCPTYSQRDISTIQEWSKLCRLRHGNKRNGIKEYLVGEMRVDTVGDWEERKASILKYLMQDFFRFVQGKVDRKNNNQHRAKTWRVWERICIQAIKSLQEDKTCKVLPVTRKARDAPLDLKMLNKQGVACLVRSYIFTGGDPSDLSLLFGYCAEMAFLIHKNGDLSDVIKRAIIDKIDKVG